VPTCRDMSELVTDYMEGATSVRLRLTMWLHLLRCDACRHYFDQMRRTIALIGSGQVAPPDQALEDAVLATRRTAEQRDS
jgi:predicted anti-sigma-YlaC factor YlaD